MKKITDLLKPNILIIFGAIYLLVYLNWLAYGGAGLALGIIAVIFSACYLAIGILGAIIGDKLSPMLKKVFDIVAVSMFPIFMFVYFLLMTINVYQGMGPTSWIIYILGMVASLTVVGLYIVSRFAKMPIMQRLAYLFAAIFALALLLNILFDIAGATNVLGNISIIEVVLYGLYLFYLFNALGKVEEAPQEEPAPAQEAPQEDPVPQAAPEENVAE